MIPDLFVRVNLATDRFYWQFSQLNHWLYESTRELRSADLLTRCQLKLRQDLALLDVVISDEEVQVFMFRPESTFVDTIAAMGKQKYFNIIFRSLLASIAPWGRVPRSSHRTH